MGVVKNNFHKKLTLCWSCKNAVPDGKHGCSWSKKLEPVDGWEAIENSVIRIDGSWQHEIKSARVIKCPKFEPD